MLTGTSARVARISANDGDVQYRYRADITAGALKVPESRVIADLLLRELDAEGWKDAIVKNNVLQESHIQRDQPEQHPGVRWTNYRRELVLQHGPTTGRTGWCMGRGGLR